MIDDISRPTGVAILAGLEIFFAILSIIGGLVLIGTGATMQGLFGGLAALFGLGILILGIIALAIGLGLWFGKTWAWWLALFFGIVNILVDLFSLPVSIIGLAIQLVILYYLTRPHVKAYFKVRG